MEKLGSISSEIVQIQVAKILTPLCVGAVWQYGLWSFQTGDTKLERFLPKNQHTQRK